MYEEQREKLRQKQYLEYGEAIKYHADGRRIPWEVKRRYASIKYIEKIMIGNKTKRSKETRIKMNLKKRQYFIPILKCLIDKRLPFHDCLNLKIELKTGTTKMEAKRKNKDGKWLTIEANRVPVFVRPKPSEIAGRLGISEPSVYNYLKAMEVAGLAIRTKKDNVRNPSSAYRIIGGWVENRYDVNNQPLEHPHIFPVYFWGQSQPKIKDVLENFSL